MPATVITISDEIVETLNDATLSQSFAATRAYAPIFCKQDEEGEDELATLRVTVVPSLLTVAARDLAPRDGFEWEIAVWVQKRVENTTAAIDPLMNLMEEIIDLFRVWRTRPNTRLIGIEASPVSPEWVDTQRAFASAITLTVRVTR